MGFRALRLERVGCGFRVLVCCRVIPGSIGKTTLRAPFLTPLAALLKGTLLRGSISSRVPLILSPRLGLRVLGGGGNTYTHKEFEGQVGPHQGLRVVGSTYRLHCSSFQILVVCM